MNVPSRHSPRRLPHPRGLPTLILALALAVVPVGTLRAGDTVVRGRVTEWGRAAEGIRRVLVRAFLTTDHRTPVATALTDETGAYVLAKVPKGPVVLEFEKDDYSQHPTSREVDLAAVPPNTPQDESLLHSNLPKVRGSDGPPARLDPELAAGFLLDRARRGRPATDEKLLVTGWEGLRRDGVAEPVLEAVAAVLLRLEPAARGVPVLMQAAARGNAAAPVTTGAKP